MEPSAQKRLRLGGIVLFAAAVLLCQAEVVHRRLTLANPFEAALRGIEGDWKGGRLVTLKVPPEVEKRTGVREGDVLEAIESPSGAVCPIRSESELTDSLTTLAFGRPFALHILRPGPGGEKPLRMEIAGFPPPPPHLLATLTALLPTILFCLLCVATALFIGFARPEEPAALRASLVFLCVATLPWGSAASFFAPVLRELGLAVWIFPFSLATAVFMRFFLLFPVPSPIDRRFPWLKKAGLIFGFTFGAWNYSWHYLQLRFPVAFERFLLPFRPVDYCLDVLYVVCFLVGLASLLLNTVRAEGVDERRRCRLLLCGSAGVFPWLGIYITSVTVGIPYLPAWVRYANLLFLAAFPLSFAYTVLRHRVFGVRVILRRGLRFALLSNGFLLAEAVLVFLAFYFGAMPLAAGPLRDTPPVALAAGTAGLTALVVLGIRRLNQKVMPRIERHFFREAYDARAILTDLARSVRKLSASPEALFTTVTSTLLKSLHPDRAAVYLRGSEILRMPAGDPAHRALARLEAELGERFTLITQNVDGLHPLAGSRNVLELHGSLWRVRCLKCGVEREDRTVPFPELPPRCGCGGVLRPAIVWFGEMLPAAVFEAAHGAAQACDLFLVIGTSGVVEPAASLGRVAASAGAEVWEVNPEASALASLCCRSFRAPAGEAMDAVVDASVGS